MSIETELTKRPIQSGVVDKRPTLRIGRIIRAGKSFIFYWSSDLVLLRHRHVGL